MHDIAEILDNWTKQRTLVADLGENELKTLISLETKGRARNTVAISAHQRLSKLRTAREREALEAKLEKGRERNAKLAARKLG